MKRKTKVDLQQHQRKQKLQRKPVLRQRQKLVLNHHLKQKLKKQQKQINHQV